MKEFSMKKEIERRPVGETKDLKTKERNLVKELFKKEKETSIQAQLKREINQFESLDRKEMPDYSMFIIKLQSIKDQMEYQRDTSEGSTSSIEKQISEVDKLMEKYKKEQFNVCMQRSDAMLDRVQKVLSL